ncbi:putative tartrate:succinate antiporter [Klebsiella pneumoniae]|uniref:Putative tartrate:succinate antiporter n=1 Tax=Klebsiella pneumoniae TaxID=573 RepID=A0A447RI10_KLEPN|nr:putative tartrate:succinate antiporter [Klebsiella pneumoniae]
MKFCCWYSSGFALMMWIFAADWDRTGAGCPAGYRADAVTGVLSWSDITNNKSGMEHLCLVRHPGGTGDGLSSTGFIAWAG